MAKTILKFIVILFMLAVLAIGGFVGWFKYEESKYAATAVPYVKQVVPELARWNSQETKKYMSAEALTASSDEEFEKNYQLDEQIGETEKSRGAVTFKYLQVR